MSGRLRAAIVSGAPMLAAASPALALAGLLAEDGADGPGDAAFVAVWVVLAVFGAVLARRSPERDIGAILLLVGFVFCASVAAHGWAVRALRLDSLPLGAPAAWVATWLGGVATGLLPLALLAVPTGRAPRRHAVVVAVACAAVAAAQSVATEPLEGVDPALRPIANPLGVEGLRPAVGVVTAAGVVTLVAMTIVALWRMLRSLRSSPATKVQLRWVVTAVLLVPITFVVSFVVEALGALALSNALAAVGYVSAVVLLVAAVGASTARHRLYAIDGLVDRTMVFATLTGIAVIVYGAIVGSATMLFSDRAMTTASLLATAVVAVGFSTAHGVVRRWTSRWLFGDRVEPYEVLAALGARLEATIATGDVLPALVAALGDALDTTSVAIDLREGDRFVVAATTAEPVVAAVTTPIVAGGEVVGQLRVGERRSSARFGDAERRLLDDVARQAAVAIQGLRLLADLQRSRAAAVQGREEERRRLQRDLHDGLGPALAGLVLEAEAAQRLVGTSPDAASAALDEVVGQLKSATTEVRRITRGLRPAVLDQLGLVGALREHAATFMADETLAIELDAEPDLRLPAAVEVAAYRIVCEALTNVVRHSQATRCRVAIAVDTDLVMEVCDDGVGASGSPASGIGLRSMEERAVELGGALTVNGRAGAGTRVSVRLPLR